MALAVTLFLENLGLWIQATAARKEHWEAFLPQTPPALGCSSAKLSILCPFVNQDLDFILCVT